jgi:hypothetical protein
MVPTINPPNGIFNNKYAIWQVIIAYDIFRQAKGTPSTPSVSIMPGNSAKGGARRRPRTTC